MNDEELQAARDAVVKEALNSTWNASGGDQVRDAAHGLVCRIAGCGLYQSILATIASWDSDDVFGMKPLQMANRN